jgi:hypothetical protein
MGNPCGNRCAQAFDAAQWDRTYTGLRAPPIAPGGACL